MPCHLGPIANKTINFTVCHHKAECTRPRGLPDFSCSCVVGWAGDGVICGRDIDGDSLPDEELNCSSIKCREVILLSDQPIIILENRTTAL